MYTFKYKIPWRFGGVRDYRRGFGLLDLLTTYMSHCFHTLHFTIAHTSALSLLQSTLSVSWQRILRQGL
jgi:hypothetical protein